MPKQTQNPPKTPYHYQNLQKSTKIHICYTYLHISYGKQRKTTQKHATHAKTAQKQANTKKNLRQKFLLFIPFSFV